jgi:hypothetical protein
VHSDRIKGAYIYIYIHVYIYIYICYMYEPQNGSNILISLLPLSVCWHTHIYIYILSIYIERERCGQIIRIYYDIFIIIYFVIHTYIYNMNVPTIVESHIHLDSNK